MILNQGEIEITLYDTIETITSEYTYTYDLNTKKWIEIESPNLPTQGDDTQGTGTGNTTGNGTGSNTGGNNQGGSTKPNKPNSGGGMIPMERSAVKRIAISTSPITNTTGGNTTGGSSTTQLPDILNNGQVGEGTTTQPTVTRMLQTDKQEGIKETATTTTITNTITANITKANVWVIAHSATYEKDNPPIEYPLGEEGITTECDPKNEPEPEEEGEWKTNRVETTKETNIKKGWKLANSNTSIEPDIFLGLWKNGFGKYVEGAVYTPNGKVVKYTLPGSVKKTLNEDGTETLEGNVQETPVRVLLSAEDMFYTLLENREDTQMHAQIMRELIAYYKADGDYEINVDLSIFDTSEFTGVTSIVGGTIQEKVWFSLINLGFSEEAVAGAMGNIHYESGGFNPNSIEGGYTENTGGIGICQWTNTGRGNTGRNTDLKNYAASKGKTWQDEEVQVQFLLTEITGSGDAQGYAHLQFMTTTYGSVKWNKDSWSNPKGTTSDDKIEYATKAFCYTFERPSEYYAQKSMNNRIQYAKMYYEQFHGKTATAGDYSGDVVRYYQQDYNDAYGTSTIANCGCGPTSFAMVATHLTGQVITPKDAIAWCGNAYYVSGSGTSWSYFNAAAKHFGLSYNVKPTSSFAEVENALKNGKLVISSQGKGIFTSGGHYILLTKMIDGKIFVNDPNKTNAISKGYNNRAFTASEITQSAKQYWIFE